MIPSPVQSLSAGSSILSCGDCKEEEEEEEEKEVTRHLDPDIQSRNLEKRVLT